MLDHQPLVSVIISVYNREKYIKECIDSVLNQTYKNIEIIIINDGSTDGSLKIIESYQTKYPEKIKVASKANGGVSSSVNTGIKIMKGEWLKLIDSDDVLVSDAIEKLIEITKQYTPKHILYGHFSFIDSSGNFMREYKYEDHNNEDNFTINSYLLHDFFANFGTNIIHRSAFDYCTFNESLEYSEDYEILLKLCIVYGFRLIYMPKIICNVRIHDFRISNKHVFDVFKQNEKIKEMVLNQLEKSEQIRYKNKLKQLSKNLSLRTRFRNRYPYIMSRIIGKNSTYRILNFYRRIKTKRIKI